jgi:hypothetical protein
VIRLSLCKEKITLAVSAIFLHFKSLEKKKIWVGTIIFLVSVSYPYRTVFIWIGSRVLMTKNKKTVFCWKNLIFLGSKTTFCLSLGLYKGFKSFRRSLQPFKENIQLFKT